MQVLDASYPSNIEDDLFDDTATAVFDAQLLEAIELVNMDLKQQTRQVVLLGCGLDTRPYRHVFSPAHAFCHRCYVISLARPPAFGNHAASRLH